MGTDNIFLSSGGLPCELCMLQFVMGCLFWKTGRKGTSLHTRFARGQRVVYSVKVIEDTKIPNAATIKIFKQEHPLADMIRS